MNGEPPPQRKRRCASCGNSYMSRPRSEPICLTCDIVESAARGESNAQIATRLGLPCFLIEATAKTCRERGAG